jgi:oxalate decarboxylase/phosphoglucose isomerase-like protein (cupin superfamily)
MPTRVYGFWTGLLVGVALTVAASFGTRFVVSAAAQEPQAGRPVYKIVLENDRVRVRDVTFAPGVADNGMHTHEYAHVGVILTKGSLVFTEPGGKTETVPFEAGSVGYRDAHVTHMTSNPGPNPMRVIEVELK